VQIGLEAELIDTDPILESQVESVLQEHSGQPVESIANP
jgi:hypothetical protein